MSTAAQLACGVAAILLTLAVLLLMVVHGGRRKPAPEAPQPWALALVANEHGQHPLQCPDRKCGRPVDVVRGRPGGQLVSLEPCGHLLTPTELQQAMGGAA